MNEPASPAKGFEPKGTCPGKKIQYIRTGDPGAQYIKNTLFYAVKGRTDIKVRRRLYFSSLKFS